MSSMLAASAIHVFLVEVGADGGAAAALHRTAGSTGRAPTVVLVSYCWDCWDSFLASDALPVPGQGTSWEQQPATPTPKFHQLEGSCAVHHKGSVILLLLI